MFNRKNFKRALALIGIAALLFAGFTWLKPGAQEPSFPKDAVGPAPAVMFEVERDFGWRTGDLVPITIYIKEFPGTKVDTDGLALEGDFEVKGDADVQRQATADGGSIIRVKMVVQSFAFKPAQTARVSMTWNRNGTKEWNEVPKAELVLHTSATYDGRQAIQEGHLVYSQGWHLVTLLLIVFGGIAGIVFSTKWINHLVRTKKAPPKPKREPTLYEWAVERFDAAWTRIEAGDRSDEPFHEIDAVVRKLLHLETVQPTQLEVALQDHPMKRQALYILKTCERKLFRGDRLQERYVAPIKVCFDQLVSRR